MATKMHLGPVVVVPVADVAHLAANIAPNERVVVHFNLQSESFSTVLVEEGQGGRTPARGETRKKHCCPTIRCKKRVRRCHGRRRNALPNATGGIYDAGIGVANAHGMVRSANVNEGNLARGGGRGGGGGAGKAKCEHIDNSR